MTDSSWFRVLGPVRAGRGPVEAELGAPQQRLVLAALMAEAGRPVPVATIADVLWRDAAPSSATATIQQYVSRLRRVLDRPGEPGVIRRVMAGYQLVAEDVDVRRWQALVERGRSAARLGSADAVEVLGEALALWSGPIAADVTPEGREHPLFAALTREHTAVLCEAADLALAADRGDDFTPVLQRAVTWYPFDEGVHARLIRVLAATGRRADALRHYQAVRRSLVDELGVEPGPQLQEAHRAVLAEEETVAVSRGPAMLPPDPRSFRGRAAELDALDALMTGEMPLVVVTGLGGAGKTSLALRWAYRQLARFPDGQLYIDLRGFAPGNVPVEPAEALRTLLEALGISRANQPSAQAELSALYRTVLAGRRVLVVLDNARDDEQVRPLLPGAAGSSVLVTSRSYLGGLVVEDGAHPMELAVLSEAEAYGFLRSLLGDRVQTGSAAAATIIEVCGGLPLALGLCAAWVRRNPRFTLDEVATALRQEGLDAFTGVVAGRDVRAVFSWSYQCLGEEAARLFRALGTHPGVEVAAATAASIAGRGRAATQRLLTELLDAQLLQEHRPGRYRMHDLVRAYAIELSDPEERHATVRRIVDHYVHSLVNGARVVGPHRALVEMAEPVAGVTPWRPVDAEQVAAWFGVEHANLLAVFDAATDHDLDAAVWPMIWALDFLHALWPGRAEKMLPMIHQSLAAAERRNATWWVGYLRHSLGSWYFNRGEDEESLRHLEAAAQFGRDVGDPIRTAGALTAIASILVDLEEWPTDEQIEQAAARAEEARELATDFERNTAPGRLLQDRTRARQIIADSYKYTAFATLRHTGDRDAAIAELDKGLRMHDGDPYLASWVLEIIARFHSHLGDDTAAIRTYERAIDLGGDDVLNSDMPLLMARCYVRLGNAEGLERIRERTLKVHEGVYNGKADELRAALLALEVTPPG